MNVALGFQIIDNFIVFLDEWEEEAKIKKSDFLTDSTCYGLKISLRATLQICKFLVEKCGFFYLMTARLNQDSLERFFGLMRNCCGSNEHPDSIIFIQMYRLVATYSLVKPPKGSNISGGEVLDVLLNLKDISNVNDRWELWTGKIDTIIDKRINSHEVEDANKLLEDHDFFSTTSDYVLTYVSGFVARKAQRFVTFNNKVACEACTRSLIFDGTKEEIPERHKLIALKDHGYLKHPSIKLFDLISVLEHGTLQVIREKDLNPETIFDITEAIEKLPSTPLLGCEGHAIPLTQRIVTFYIVTRMFFICKQANKNDCIEKRKTQEKRKLSKLSYAPDIKSNENSIVSNNYKPNTPPITLKPPRKRKALTNITNF